MQYRTIIMSHLPIRPTASRLITTAGAIVAACAIAPVACAAASSSAAPTTPAARTAPATNVCAGASDLRLRIPDGKGTKTDGITYYTLDFTNTTGSTCSLSGYPYVSVISRGGHQLGSPAGHGLMTIAPLIRLAPGATAHTTLAYQSGKVSAAVRDCGPVEQAYQLRVYVAGQKLALYAGWGFHACSRIGQVFLSVTQPFRAGAGPS